MNATYIWTHTLFTLFTICKLKPMLHCLTQRATMSRRMGFRCPPDRHLSRNYYGSRLRTRRWPCRQRGATQDARNRQRRPCSYHIGEVVTPSRSVLGTRYSWPATLIAATRACNAAARWAGPRRRHSMPTLPLSVDQASPGRDTANCPRRPRPRQRRPERQRERDEAGARGRGGRGEREPRRSSGDNLEAAAKVNKGRRRETETGLTGNDDHRYRTEIGRRQCRQSALTCRIMSSRPLADFIASFQRGLMAELGVETIRGQML